MSNDQLYSIFPTPVLLTSYPFSYEEEIEYLKEISFDEGQIHSNIITAQSKDNYILNNPKLEKVKNFIQTKLNQFSKEVFEYDEELIVTQSWVNWSTKGNTHNRHSHPNSVISGVWYLEMPEDCKAPIRFHNPIVREISLKTTGVNQYNGLDFTLLPKSSNLIFFPSNLHHDVLKNESDGNRITIAFNSWPKESFGNKQYLTSTSAS